MAWAVYRVADNVVMSGHLDSVSAMTARIALGTTSQFNHVRVDDAAGVEAELPVTFRPESLWILNGVIQTSPVATLDQLKAAAQAQRDRLCALSAALGAEEEFYAPKNVTLARAFLSSLFWGSRAVFLSTELTAAAKLAWVRASALGPSDLNAGTAAMTVDQARNFFPTVTTWSDAERERRTPSGALLSCTPASGNERFTLASMRAGSEAVTGLADSPTEIAEIRKIASGAWIDEIVA